jgi:hypothetical protein
MSWRRDKRRCFDPAEAPALLDSVDVSLQVGLRNRAQNTRSALSAFGDR